MSFVTICRKLKNERDSHKNQKTPREEIELTLTV